MTSAADDLDTPFALRPDQIRGYAEDGFRDAASRAPHAAFKNQRLAAVGYVWAFAALTHSTGARAPLEREAATTPGMLYFGHLLYEDESWYPSEIETGILRGAELEVHRFDNRSPRQHN